MSVIGTFVAAPDGYVGTIRTITIHAKLRLVAVDKKARDDAPDFRILFGVQEVGAGEGVGLLEKGVGMQPV
jgi:uncharacterized protein (DUF736 family)